MLKAFENSHVPLDRGCPYEGGHPFENFRVDIVQYPLNKMRHYPVNVKNGLATSTTNLDLRVLLGP